MQNYDAYEIAPVIELIGNLDGQPDLAENCLCLEDAEYIANREAKDHEQVKIYWTLYGHLPNEGIIIISDHPDKAQAVAAYRTLSGFDGQIATGDGECLINLPAALMLSNQLNN